MYPTIAENTAKILLQINAIKLNLQNPFTWASGIKSPIYCDNRMILSFPEARKEIKKALAEKSKEFDAFDVVAGVATAGIPHGVLLADSIDAPFIYVRDKAKEHGRQNTIEGKLDPGQKVLVTEDLISTGGSSIKVVDKLIAEGAEISGVLAIFTYGFPEAIQTFQSAGVELKTLSNFSTLIKVASELGYISPESIAFLENWSKDRTTYSI